MDTLPGEIWKWIIDHVDCGSDYKSVCLVDTAFLSYARVVHPDADIKFANHLTTLLTMIDRGDYLPRGFESREQFIRLFPGEKASANPNMTLEFVDSHPNWPWYWSSIIHNPNMTTKWLETNRKKFSNWRGGPWSIVGHHSCITIDYICARPHLPWDASTFSRNPNMTLEVIAAHPEIPWCPPDLLRNPNVTWEYVISRCDEFARLTSNLSGWKPLTIENILDRPNWNWSWDWLTGHPNMTLEIIEENSDLPWDISHVLTYNPNVTIDYVLAHPEITWDWPTLTLNPNMTADVVSAHPELPWNTARFHKNPSFTWANVEKYPGGIIAPWNYCEMGAVPGLTWKKIIELDRAGTEWNWAKICRNKFVFNN